MLVLTRKKNERIMIGDNITLTIVEIRGDRVRLGVEAPNEIPVNREEVLNKLNPVLTSVNGEDETKNL